jgi:hypothetical protein
MSHWYYLTSRLLFAAGLASLACGGYGFLRTWSHAGVLLVEKPDRVLTDVIVEKEYEIGYRVFNRTSSPARIVGVDDT